VSIHETISPVAAGASERSSGSAIERGRHRHTKTPSAQESRTNRSHRYLILGCGPDDLAVIDQSSGALVRLRYQSTSDRPQFKPFELVDAELAIDPERDDIALPEAVSITGAPELVGTMSKRRVRRTLKRLIAPTERHLLGFAGMAAPYWEFRGMRPSLALVSPSIGPLLFRRKTDDTVWVRFGWSRSDNWLPVEDTRAVASLWAASRDKLTGKELTTALGFRPRYLLVALTPPRDGHCYKTVVALLPRP